VLATAEKPAIYAEKPAVSTNQAGKIKKFYKKLKIFSQGVLITDYAD
jgi:hypothetical protein